ncbi:glycogen debranching enzyme [Aquihabitans sp. G128]|uniref:glycogen debranching protein n=1 Tax=Aquihabitans sp. G128 TaxID=2849779 RepID=UPI001C24C7A8|nr:glycogen debranching enzyme [Aquihabitans sp. G128]QXC61816.1 glycogen debranching enzyme [Aquihabitans sp. G128]
MAVDEVLGATVGTEGTTFVVSSGVAERIELCLFGTDGAEADRVDLTGDRDGLWRATVAGVGHGQRYGFRVHGPGDPAAGHACDPAKLLVDPAARRVAGELQWSRELVAPGVDSSPLVPRSVVVAPLAPVPASERPGTPWGRTVVYEAHVGQLTARHPLVPAVARGRYPGLAAPAVVDHLQRLGVTAVELLPVQQFVSESFLATAGRQNVWGYNPLAWGAPHAGYATAGGDPVTELRRAVAALHEAGIEVWLDVVYNHTCEGGLGEGPILSLRGFDNAATYRLIAGPGGLVDDDVTGCGNSVDTRSPSVRRLIRETLVRWVQDFGIDGFRFDLAATLIRGDDGPTAASAFLADLAAEPALQDVKLVAEPWDTGMGGYALGRFPAPWREWNDRFRDDVRDLWRGQAGWSQGAAALTGTAATFRTPGRDATAAINPVTTHDGFTLADLVTYDEARESGHHQRSWNGGLEGPTADPGVRAGRRRRQRALLATLLCAQGVPLLLAGDELGRSQAGQANGYTLEADEWGVPWPEADWDLVAWTSAAVALRHAHPALRRVGWVDPADTVVRWLTEAGTPMGDADWTDPGRRSLQVEVSGVDLGGTDLVLLFTTGGGDAAFTLPDGTWQVQLDAAWRRPPDAGRRPVVTGTATVQGPGFAALERIRPVHAT